jgi:hypothetical protein
MLLAELEKLGWRAPWVLLEPEFRSGFVTELRAEVNSQHPLHNVEAVAVARREDNDDVLFYLPNHTPPLAVVHLAYAGRERSAEWPDTQFFDSLEDWVARCLKPDSELSRADAQAF